MGTITQQHPAGATAVLGAALAIVARKLGVDLTPDEAVTLVAAGVVLVSWRTPRHA